MKSAAAATAVFGTFMGLALSRLIWSFENPVPRCSLGPNGHCPGRPAFLPYAITGSILGVMAIGVTLLLVARSLDK